MLQVQFHKRRGMAASIEVLKQEKRSQCADKAGTVAHVTRQSHKAKWHAIHSQKWVHGAGSIRHGETSRFS